MAVSPLFFDTRDAILECVRMSGMCSDASAQPLVDRALLKVRQGIYTKLGDTKVNALVAQPYTESPTTDSEIERSKAQIIECEWFHAELLCILPTLLLEGGSRGIDMYQDENPFRLTDEESREALVKKLMLSVAEMLEDLDATDTAKVIRSALVDPDDCKGAAPDTMDLLNQPYHSHGPYN